MRVWSLAVLAFLTLCVSVGCSANDATWPTTSDGQVKNVLVAPRSNVVWTAADQVLFWAPVYMVPTTSLVRLTAADPHTLTWRHLETVDRSANRISVSSDGAAAWFVDEPHSAIPSDSLAVLYRFSLADERADTVAENRPVKLAGLHGYAHSVVAEPAAPGALYVTPPDSLWLLQGPAGPRTLVATGCATIQAVSADGSRLLCSRQSITDLVFVTLPGGETTPFDVQAASPGQYPQGFGFVNGALHVVAVTTADSAWAVWEWKEETGAAQPLFKTSSFQEVPDLAFLSDDGARIAVWTEECLDQSYGLCLGGVQARLRVFDRGTGTVTVVASHHVAQGVRGGVVAFAPDDRRIAYVIQYALYVASLD
ncbi:MAG: hypothetical protein P8099_01920 [Gemmatimonadota bacterium]|jgi:hypothetical protein